MQNIRFLSPFVLHREVSAAASCLQEGEEVITQEALSCVGSHAKYGTSFCLCPNAVWDEEPDSLEVFKPQKTPHSQTGEGL